MTKRHDVAVQHSSKRSDWRTLRALFVALHQEFGFTLDAAANPTNAHCPDWLGPGSEDPDALVVGWRAVLDEIAEPHDRLGAIFLNPPYSREERMPIDPWIKKAWQESCAGCTVVGVVPYTTQTEWFRHHVIGIANDGTWLGHAATEVRELPHRVTFLDPDTGQPANNAPGNTCIVIWKPNPGYVGPWAPTRRYWTDKEI